MYNYYIAMSAQIQLHGFAYTQIKTHSLKKLHECAGQCFIWCMLAS